MTDVTLQIRGRIESLDLKPGDTILVTLEPGEQLSGDEAREIMAVLEWHFPHNRVLILRGVRALKVAG